ncbi:uncharacterized protein LOC135392731 [Ornithodoros turicata]|uniref:uncharacterized protein LOC135392731 n=1 Tax=Ornithodoros turicata TaxID=34597 RepID=UPI003139BFCF
MESASGAYAGVSASTSDASGSSVLQHMTATSSEDVLVLDELPLQPLVPYQTVSQYGFLYTLVPQKQRLKGGKTANEKTQTAVPTATLATQTGILMPSRGTQTAITFPPTGALSFTSSQVAAECLETSGDKGAAVSLAEALLPHDDAAQLCVVPLEHASLSTSPPGGRTSTPVPVDLDTTDVSTCPPDPKDVRFQLSETAESSDTEDEADKMLQPRGLSKSRGHQTPNPD